MSDEIICCACEKDEAEIEVERQNISCWMCHDCYMKFFGNPSKITRPLVTNEELIKADSLILDKLQYRLKERGYGSFASKHEILGIIEEELKEYKDAVHANTHPSVLIDELIDIAVAALFSIACINSEKTDW